MQEERPAIRIENGYTLVDAIVAAEDGFGTGRGVTKFYKLCKQYEEEHKRKVYARTRKEGDNHERDCTNPIALFTVSCVKGETIEFKVEGTDKEAEKMALRLYSGVISENINEIDFYRFEKRIGEKE
jgi:phosphotransferase system HPr-like phosphotransfer protein